MKNKNPFKALSELKNLFLSEPELFDSRERFINNRIDVIEEALKNAEAGGDKISPDLKMILFFDPSVEKFRCKDSEGNIYGLIKITENK